jgi:hypothetical protein
LIKRKGGSAISLALFPGAGGGLYISWFVDITAHDDHFFHAEEGLRVLCSSQGQIGERTNRCDCDRVWLIVAKESQNLQVAGLKRWSE